MGIILARKITQLETQLNNNNISALARKVERLETEIKNLSKDIDRIQDNDNPLSM